MLTPDGGAGSADPAEISGGTADAGNGTVDTSTNQFPAGMMRAEDPSQGNPASGDDATPPADGAADPTAQPEAKPQVFRTFDGRELTAEQMHQEYLGLGSEFTRRSQRLAQLEKENADRASKPQEQQFTPDPTLTPEQQRTQAIINELQTRAKDSAVKEVMPQIEALKAELNNQIEAQKTMAEIQSLKAKYPDFDENAVMTYGLSHKVYDLEASYKLLNADKIAAKAAADAANKTKYEMSQKRPAGVVPGASDAQAPTGLKPYDPVADKDKSISDLLREGFAQINTGK